LLVLPEYYQNKPLCTTATEYIQVGSSNRIACGVTLTQGCGKCNLDETTYKIKLISWGILLFYNLANGGI
jgi:hypothetical protein